MGSHTSSSSGPAPLFVMGTARSGTNLLARLLSAHPLVEIAIDPYLPLLRAFRNAAMNARLDPCTAARYTAAPIQDYYFSDERLSVMDAIQSADLDLPFDAEDRPALVEALRARSRLEAPDLEPLLEDLSGTTYREIFDSALSIIAQARNAGDCAWLGTKEVWTVEFCAPLARSYPDAKFIVIVRDPRAVVASMHKLAEKDPTQRAHTLSYLRHWRKCAAFCTEYRAGALLPGRFLVVSYEHLVLDPPRVARQLCDFLGIDLDPAMGKTDGYWDAATGSVWRGNSSYAESLRGIDTEVAERWRTELRPAVAALGDLACGPEMRLFGYEPGPGESRGEAEVLPFLLSDDRAPLSWRSDFGDIQHDLGFELFRAAAVASRAALDDKSIRRCFLFRSVWEGLCAGARGHFAPNASPLISHPGVEVH